MDPDPVPPPIILAIPAPSSPPKPSSSSSNSDPPSIVSAQLHPPFSGADQAPPAPPASQFQGAALQPETPASQVQCAAVPSSVEHPPSRQFPENPTASLPSAPPAAPPPAPPAAPPVNPSAADVLPSSAPLPLVSSPNPNLAQAHDPLSSKPADLQQRSQPVRRNAQANHLLQKSYAQAAKGSPGPGFVRAHAHDVDSFARLPRTGINAIRGSREGVPTFAIAQSDLPKVEGLFSKALVMKFHGGRPSLAASHQEISNWGLESPFSIGPLTSRSFLLRFQNERDLLKTLTRPYSTLIKFPYKIFRWHSRCHIKEESCVVPIWISLPRLPLQFFAPELLESIANSIGRFLCLDKATATLARPSEARMCVEIDLSKERRQFIWIDLFEGLKQPIVYEKVPKFCSGCHVQGHTYVECSKVSLDTPQNQESDPLPAVQERPQPVRRNVDDNSVAVSHESPHQSRAPSVTAAAPIVPASDIPLQAPPDISFQQPHPSAAVSHALEQSLQSLSDPSQQQFDPPSISPAVQSSEQQLNRPITPAPLLPVPGHPPSQPDQPAAKPHLQSSLSEALQQHLAQSPTTAKASTSFSSIPDAEELPDTSGPHPADAHPNLQSTADAESHPTHPPLPSKAVASSSSQVPAAAATPYASDSHPPPAPPQPSVVQQAGHPSNPPPAAVRPTVLSAIAAPFQSSDPVQSSQQSSPLYYQQPSLLPIYINSNGATYITSLPQKSLPIGYAPNPYFTHRGSLETDSQQNSPSGSPLKDVNKCNFPPQSCVSEGEDLTEDHPGFQGHNSDVDFYQRPRSSKKNKRQPDGPLRVHLRARKGPSSRK